MVLATFSLRSAFGCVRAYPINAEAQALCSLTGSVTLLPQTITTLATLGFKCVDEGGQEITPPDLY
jgi:hypothetical protein